MNGNVIPAAGIRKRQAARQPFEKSCAKGAFQCANLLSDGALGQVEFFPGSAKVQMPRRRVEHSQTVQVRSTRHGGKSKTVDFLHSRAMNDDWSSWPPGPIFKAEATNDHKDTDHDGYESSVGDGGW